MLAQLKTLKTRVFDLVRPQLFSVADPEATLNSRDIPEFDSEWVRVQEALFALERNRPLTDEVRRLIREIERVAFETVYSVTGASDFTEFAPAISDDFGLIARGLCYDFRDPWLSGMAASYQRGVFPCGRIQPAAGGLDELLEIAA